MTFNHHAYAVTRTFKKEKKTKQKKKPSYYMRNIKLPLNYMHAFINYLLFSCVGHAMSNLQLLVSTTSIHVQSRHNVTLAESAILFYECRTYTRYI